MLPKVDEDLNGQFFEHQLVDRTRELLYPAEDGRVVPIDELFEQNELLRLAICHADQHFRWVVFNVVNAGCPDVTGQKRIFCDPHQLIVNFGGIRSLWYIICGKLLTRTTNSLSSKKTNIYFL